MSLRDLRRARKLTQARVAKTLGITQDSVSRLEKRRDLLLSTLQKTAKAMGDVRIVADFPTVRRSCCLISPRTIHRVNRHEDMHTCTLKISSLPLGHRRKQKAATGVSLSFAKMPARQSVSNLLPSCSNRSALTPDHVHHRLSPVKGESGMLMDVHSIPRNNATGSSQLASPVLV